MKSIETNRAATRVHYHGINKSKIELNSKIEKIYIDKKIEKLFQKIERFI